jgi:hypothetical protein
MSRGLVPRSVPKKPSTTLGGASLELSEQSHDAPPLVRMHRERVDQGGKPHRMLCPLVEQPERQGVAVGLVCDQ